MAVIMITGGARSGKSTYAEELCQKAGDSVTYIACAVITDEDMARRVEHHRERRPSEWTTVEQYKDFGGIAERFDNHIFLLDCVTTMITNLMFDEAINYETCDTVELERIENKIIRQVDELIRQFKGRDKTLVVVTNEVGQGVVPAYRLGSIFRDIAGRINQHIAAEADEVVCMISGLPLKLK